MRWAAASVRETLPRRSIDHPRFGTVSAAIPIIRPAPLATPQGRRLSKEFS
jgi:hypothetical protein